MQLAQVDGIDVVGINYKDVASNARRFLGLLGSPYDRVGVDPNGRTAIDWGVYGVPETFIVDGQGIIVYKHVGPISAETLEATILPMIEVARGRDTVKE
jgi:cytochrome c biogenesis protein CcmG/thiol:disulfide interchange protein DsbE